MTTYASRWPMRTNSEWSRARSTPSTPPVQPVNEYLNAMREDWHIRTVAERVEAVRGALLFIADPVSQLDEHDHETLAEYSLGELYHARLVLLRLLPHLIAAATER